MNEAGGEKFRRAGNFFGGNEFLSRTGKAHIAIVRDQGMKKDSNLNQQHMRLQPDDGLGPTSDIGSRLRALYGAVQEEGVPDQLLDLLEKLDNAERAQGQRSHQRGE